jgi:bifunctional non-homologous end joining protein LigD
MALEEYKRKRDFQETPEPPPEHSVDRKGFSYLIQKHDATRLHYDFRLELDGVLLSWAVAKGPSLNPADKRLAVRTEDHPLSYGTFEGTIPQGQYGGGTVMLWDRGSWEPKADPHAGLKEGHLSFDLHGDRLKGGWDLIRMRGNGKRENWLLIKEKDDYALSSDGAGQFLKREASSVSTHRSMDEIAVGAPKSKQGRKVGAAVSKLMKDYPGVLLPTFVDKPPAGNEWLHEVKYDGYRALAFAANGEVRLRTRNGNDWTHKFPSIHAAVAKLKVKSVVLDLEAVVIDREGKTSFQAMQRALGEGGNPQSISAYVFDLLHFDGKDWSSRPLSERKEKLAALLKHSRSAGTLRYSDHIVGNAEEVIAKSCSMGLEGIVSKRADSSYHPGRQKSWLKAKCIKRQEFVIIGYTAARKGARAIGALHLGFNQKSRMKYAGKVGTGFTMKSAQELYDRLIKIKVDKPLIPALPRKVLKGATWVRPQLLCEVAFTEWTEDGHIRHPSFQGLREDKKPQEVVMEQPVQIDNHDSAMSVPLQRAELAHIEVLGIKITHPDRVIFDDSGMTKGKLAEYYAAVSPWVLKDLAGHPVSLLRCPEGTAGGCFYQRSPGKGLGPDVKPFTWKHKGKSYEYLYIENEHGLIEFIQMGVIELHPWGARVGNIDRPDRLVFDLDPADDLPFEAVKLAAGDLRQRLERKGLTCYLKCTGGKGLHVTVPLIEKSTWVEVKTFCAAIANAMVRDVPDAYVATMRKEKRKGKIFVDYFRNDYTATAIADFAVRARPSAPVAVPLEWSELDKLHAANQFTTEDVLKRLKRRRPDPARYDNRQKLPS